MAEDDRKERVFSESNFSHTAAVFQRPSYGLVLPVIFLYFMIVFGIYPLTFQIHIDQVCADLDEADCESSEVSAKASTLNLMASLALSVSSILSCGIFGSIADVYGRKIAMITPIMGLMIYDLAYLYVDMFNPKSFVIILVTANFIMGISGSYFTFIMAGLCYVSDATISAPHTRKTAYSYAEASIFAPEVFAPVLTGVWATYYGYFIPLLLGLITGALALIYLFLLPESLPPDAPSRKQTLRVNPLQTFTNLKFLFTYKFETAQADEASDNAITRTQPEDPGASPLPLMGISFLIYFMAAMGQAAVRIVYWKHAFGWNSSLIGIYDGLEGLVISLSMIFAPRVMEWLFGWKLKIITWVQIGYLTRIVHWTIYGFMRSTVGIFALLPLLLFVGPLAPFIRTIMSNSVPTAQQAQIFSAFSALEGIASLLGPLYSAAYTLLVQEDCAWMIFEIMGTASAVALLIVVYVRSNERLARHLPEDKDGDHGHGVLETGEGECDEDVFAFSDRPRSPDENVFDEDVGLIEGELRVASMDGLVRRSVDQRAPSRGCSMDESTLLFRHLSNSSATAGMRRASRSVDGFGSSVTARLLADSATHSVHRGEDE